jgi:acetylornithine aminotransferase
MFEQMDKDFILHSYGRNYVNFTKAKGAKIWDSEGNEYIDFTSGIGVVSVGHANERVTDAICDQAKKIIHISNLFLIEPQAEVAKSLVEKSGYDMRCFFANSGAEANEGAIKIARKYGEVDGEPKRYKVITLKHSFHGRTISTLKATGQEKMHNYFGPYPDGFVYADDIDHIASLIDDHTVCVMIELVQGEGGVEPQDKAKVQELAKLLKSKDILLAIDEVQTGIYRTGELFAANLYEIEPDIITVAKGLGNGVPIGVVMTTLKDIFSPGDHGSTFGGNYLVTRAAYEVLEILEGYKNSGGLDEAMLYFERKLRNLVERYPEIVEKEVGLGLMRGLRIRSAELLTALVENSFKEQLLVLKAGRNTLRFLPPLTISAEEIDAGFAKLEKAFAATKA